MEANGERPQVVALDLLSAFRQPGCPLCRICQQAADRHLFGLLWESVGNMSVRLRLIQSLGFCPEHTWQLYRLATDEFAGETGTPILYKDIVNGVLDHLRAIELNVPGAVPTVRRQKEQARRRVRAQTPTHPCPACADVAAAKERNLHWLVAGCADAAFRDRYAASDGLCLPHLHQAVENAVQSDPDAAHFLVRLSILRGEALIADLDEHIRKQAWENRFETLNETEENAPRRAARFLGGLEADEEIKSRREQRRAERPSIKALKQRGLRIDE